MPRAWKKQYGNEQEQHLHNPTSFLSATFLSPPSSRCTVTTKIVPQPNNPLVAYLSSARKRKKALERLKRIGEKCSLVLPHRLWMKHPYGCSMHSRPTAPLLIQLKGKGPREPTSYAHSVIYNHSHLHHGLAEFGVGWGEINQAIVQPSEHSLCADENR
uniref:Uncharacterized protein n=1 Tax=Sphaerodactylus townsendi TaxID=933632 RepID=A0ACB8GCW9_9SAUR